MRLVQRTMARYEWEAMPTAWYIKVRSSSQQIWEAVFSLKTQLDQNFGCTWHVVVGEDFSVDIDFEV